MSQKCTAGWWYTYPSEKYEFVSWDDSSQLSGKIKHVPNHQPTRLVVYPHGTFVSTSSRTVLATTDESNNSHGQVEATQAESVFNVLQGAMIIQVIFPLVIPEIFYNHMIWYDIILYMIYDTWHMIWYDMIWYNIYDMTYMIWYDMKWWYNDI